MTATASRRRPLLALAGLLALPSAGMALAQTTSPAAPPATERSAGPSPEAVEAGRALTRNLNSGPPSAVSAPPVAPVTTPATPPAAPPPVATHQPTAAAPTVRTTAPQPAPARTSPQRTTPSPANPAPARSTPAVTAPAPRTSAPAVSAPRTSAPPPSAPTPVRPAPGATPPAGSAPVYAPPRLPGTAAPAPVTPSPTAPAGAAGVLGPAAIAALPFRIELPPGFTVERGRPGPDFDVYSVRRGDRSFVMVYTGPASQFPIYSGETVQAAGRTSIVVVEGGQRHAMEHLFQRGDAPREIHVWVASLDGADAALAERIAQTVDPR